MFANLRWLQGLASALVHWEINAAARRFLRIMVTKLDSSRSGHQGEE